MKTKSIFFAALLICGAVLAACGDTESGETGTTAAQGGQDTAAGTDVTEKTALEALPTEDFSGYIFHVLSNNQDNRQLDMATVGEENGDALNDLVYRRNRAVEEKYNITLEVDDKIYSDVIDSIRREVTANSADHDLYLASGHAVSLAAEGLLYALNDLPNLDLSNVWWDKAALSQLSIGEQNYFATGDINPTTLMSACCMVFNKRLFDNYDMAYPYDLAKDGKRTMDRMIEMSAGMTSDLNGDGKMTYGDDQFSLSGWMAAEPYAFFYGAGGMLSQKNADDIPTLYWDVDAVSNIYNKMYTLIIENNSYYVKDVSQYDTNFTCFSEGYAFFNQLTLLKIDNYLRDMKDDYGIIPMPKFDENQATYISAVNAAADYAAVPACATDPARTGRILEALAAGAHDGITPSLYEVITKTKNVRDEESAEMVTLITRNLVFDPFYINLLDGYDFYANLLNSSSKEVASTMEKQRSAAEKSLNKLVESYQEQGQ